MMARSGSGESVQGARWCIEVRLALLVLLLSIDVAAAAETPERIAWRMTPIAVELTVGSERLVHFPEAMTVGVPPAVQGLLRVQSIAGTLYLLAREAFYPTRVIVRGRSNGQVYLLDLSATSDPGDNTPLEVYLPDEDAENRVTEAGTETPPTYGYVALTRYAAQQLYAPARLLHDLTGVVRIPVKREVVALVRGDVVEASPLIAWRAGDRYVTAVMLTNKTREPQILDPRTLRGRWLTATLQHNRLHATGSEADRTVVYLVSDRPFATALR